MVTRPSRTSGTLPERGEPRLAICEACRHRHACYAAERPGGQVGGGDWTEIRVCLGCLMRAGDGNVQADCAECTVPG